MVCDLCITDEWSGKSIGFGGYQVAASKPLNLHTWSDGIIGLLCPVSWGTGTPAAGAAGILYTASSAATGFSGAAGSACL